VREDQVRQHVSELDMHKLMGLEGHPQVLRELADGIMRPLLMIFERLWQLGEVSEDWRRGPILRKGQEGGPRELQGSELYLGPWAR